MSELRFRTPLQHRSEPSGLSIGLREIEDRGMIDLRGLASDPAFLETAKSVLATDLPLAPRTSAGSGDITILWLSIDQWLILCPRNEAPNLLEELRKALAAIHSLAVDVSDMRAVIRLEGEGVREVLLKGSSLDLLGEGYPPGTVRRLLFAEIAALIHVIQRNAFDLYVFRSYADYVWDFLLAAARSGAAISLFGKQLTPPV
jgi:sarcosine oxidase subunit gamma